MIIQLCIRIVFYFDDTFPKGGDKITTGIVGVDGYSGIVAASVSGSFIDGRLVKVRPFSSFVCHQCSGTVEAVCPTITAGNQQFAALYRHEGAEVSFRPLDIQSRNKRFERIRILTPDTDQSFCAGCHPVCICILERGYIFDNPRRDDLGRAFERRVDIKVSARIAFNRFANRTYFPTSPKGLLHLFSCEWINILFQRHLIIYYVVLKLCTYVFSYFLFVFPYCINIVPSAPKVSIPIPVF